MNINKNAWHYNFYCWTYNFWETRIPTQTNLCQYIQRMIWMTLFITLCMVACTVLVIVYAPLFLIIGWRPSNPWTTKSFFVQYPLPKVFGFKLYPIYLIVLLGVPYLDFHLFKHSSTAGWHAALIFQGVIVLIAAIAGLTCWLTDSNLETRFLVSSWIAAKKKGICPLITFSDDATTNLSTEKDQ